MGDNYNELVNGFLGGHLYIPIAPPKSLLALSDPYNPALNYAFQSQFHDLSLYHGHFYLSWGPSPVLSLLLPWRILHLGALPLSSATFLFSVLGLAVWLALFELLLRAYAPRAPLLLVFGGGVALGCSSVVPYLLRRPDVYEVALTCAYLFTGLGLLLIARTICLQRGLLFGAVGGGCLAVAAGGRFELLVLGLVVLGASLIVWRRSPEPGSGRGIRQAALFASPWLVGALLVLGYNVVRFGSPLQIGSAYQLALFDPTATPYDQVSYLAPSLYYYLIAPLRPTLAFPFVALPPPAAYFGSVPLAYRPEIIGGLLTTTPVLLVLAAVRGIRYEGSGPSPRLIVGALVATAMLVILAISYAVPGGTMRYESDVASMLLLGALVVLACWRPSHRAGRVAVTTLGGVALFFGAFAGVAISITGPNDQLHTENPSLYNQVEDAFSPLQGFVASLNGGARVVRVIDPVLGYPQNLGLYGSVNPSAATVLAIPEEVEVVSPASGRYVLAGKYQTTASVAAGTSFTLMVQDAKTTRSAVVRSGSTDVPVALASGLNRLSLWVTTSKPLPPGAPPDLLSVHDLRIKRAP